MGGSSSACRPMDPGSRCARPGSVGSEYHYPTLLQPKALKTKPRHKIYPVASIAPVSSARAPCLPAPIATHDRRPRGGDHHVRDRVGAGHLRTAPREHAPPHSSRHPPRRARRRTDVASHGVSPRDTASAAAKLVRSPQHARRFQATHDARTAAPQTCPRAPARRRLPSTSRTARRGYRRAFTLCAAVCEATAQRSPRLKCGRRSPVSRHALRRRAACRDPRGHLIAKPESVIPGLRVAKNPEPRGQRNAPYHPGFRITLRVSGMTIIKHPAPHRANESNASALQSKSHLRLFRPRPPRSRS